jgi:hypothetical protein
MGGQIFSMKSAVEIFFDFFSMKSAVEFFSDFVSFWGICFDGPKNEIILPCAHLLYCTVCVKKLERPVCPSCKGPIVETKTVFS